jgi:autotransporter-associated beta strand protein
LTKTGTGVLTLSGANTFTGGAKVQGGTLRLTTGSLAVWSNSVVSAGATLDVRSSYSSGTAVPITINGDGVGGAGALLSTIPTSLNFTKLNVVLGSNSTIGYDAPGFFNINQLSGNYNLTKVGQGRFSVSSDARTAGATILGGGCYLVVQASGNPTISPGNLTLNGGTLAVYHASATTVNFTRALGAGASQVQWTGDGGFGVFQTTNLIFNVNIGGNATPSPLKWGQQYFVPDGKKLIFTNVDMAGNGMVFKNPLNLADTADATRTIQVGGGLTTMEGAFTETGPYVGALEKSGNGILYLSSTAHTYSGATSVSGGTLRVPTNALGDAMLLQSSNLKLNGGVLSVYSATGSTVGFTRALGTGSNQIQWTDSGGLGCFNTAGLSLEVNLGGNATPDTLSWGQSYFVPNGKELLFNRDAAGTIVWKNPIDLAPVASATRIIRVANGTVTMEGLLSETSPNYGSLEISGAGVLATGTLVLAGDSANTYTGTTTVREGTLRLKKTSGNAIAGDITVINTLPVVAAHQAKLVNDASDQIADTSVFTFDGYSNSQGAEWWLNGFNETVKGISGDLYSFISNYSATTPSVLTIDTAGSDYVFDGCVRNAGTQTLALIKKGAGSQTLAGLNANSAAKVIYTGGTTVEAGTLRLNSPNAGPWNNAVVQSGATIDVLGGPTSTATVTINGGGVDGKGALLTSAAAINCPSLNVNLGSPSAIGYDGTSYFIFGNLYGDYNLTKVGQGRAMIAAGGYDSRTSGTTTIDAGTFMVENYSGFISLSPGNLILNGGTLSVYDPTTTGGVSIDFTRALGTGENQVQWTGSGGFGNFLFPGMPPTVLNINLGGNSTPDPLSWGQQYFVPDGKTLLVNAGNSASYVVFKNPIDLAATGNATRTIEVSGGPYLSAVSQAVMEGVLSQTAGNVGGLTKTGIGVLVLKAENTYTGTTTISEGTLTLDATGQIANSSSIANGATFLVADGSHVVNAITGTGVTSVIGTASLTAPSIVQGTLSIGGSGAMAAVPEPGTFALLALAGGLSAIYFRRKTS